MEDIDRARRYFARHMKMLGYNITPTRLRKGEDLDVKDRVAIIFEIEAEMACTYDQPTAKMVAYSRCLVNHYDLKLQRWAERRLNERG